MIIIIFGLLLLVWFVFSDTQTNRYTDINDVKRDKAIIRGWIPEIIPISAYEIEETHNLDINTVFGTFRYKEKDEKNFLKSLTLFSDDNRTMKWNDFLFKVDKEKNYVKFENMKYEMVNK